MILKKKENATNRVVFFLDKHKQIFYNQIDKTMEVVRLKKEQRQILHVDVNNAFLSWTALSMLKQGSKIDIREIPAIIGGDESKRSGIVLAKSMKAKECGIKTAETIYQAKAKCPNLSIYPSNFEIYRTYSNKLYQLLCEYTDQIERFSIDECFLDMTHFLMKGNLLEKAKEINKRVKEELEFTVNIGVAHNKLLAKMASDFTKPDKIHTLWEEEIPTKMWPLPISELFMLGKKTVPKLYHKQIKTIGDLAHTPEEKLIKQFGKQGKMLWEYANGIDHSEVKSKPEKSKGIGNSITLPQNLVKKEKIEEIVLALTEQVTYRLRRQNMLAEVVNIQLRTKDFVDFSHQGKLPTPTANTKIILEKAKELIREMYHEGTPIRLIGVRVDHLKEKEEGQISLFEQTKQNTKQEKLDKTIDQLKEKYGYHLITRAGNLEVENMIQFRKEKE
jgi:DNA polymerase-4